MRYKYIDLRGYKRLGLGSIKRLTMTIESPLQLILGTNGSGKSSLLEQLTPLPPSPADFEKNGSKIIHVEHNNQLYILSSVFGQSHPHSFLLDGVELNEGGTITVQKELVKHHFGITAEIHDLLLGKETFDKMSPARRKEWFLRLCDTNYDYAIALYNRLREKHRDITGAIKIAKNTLVQESEKLLQDEEIERLQKEIKQLHDFLSGLFEIRKPVESDVDTMHLEQEALDRTLMQSARQLEALHERTKDLRLGVLDYDALIAQAHEEYVRSSALIDRISKDYRDNEKKIAVLQKADQQSISDLERDSATLQEQVRLLLSQCLFTAFVDKPHAVLNAFQAVKDSLATIMSEIPINTDGRYSYQKLVESREKLADLKRRRANAAESLHSLNTRIEHQIKHRDNPDMHCPKCNHSFSASYKEATYLGLVAEAQTCTEAIEKFDAEIITVEAYNQACAEYGTFFRQFNQIVTGTNGLCGYLDWLNSQGFITERPREGVHALVTIEKDLTRQIELEQITAKIAEKASLLQSLREIGSADLKVLLDQNEQYSNQLSSLTTEMQRALQSKSVYQQEQTSLRQVDAYLKTVKDIIRQKKELSLETKETLRRHALNNLIRQVQSELATKEQAVGAASLQKEIVKNLAARIEEFTNQEHDLAILIKRLSPTEGLIAEGLLGFIKNFIDQMNSLIAKIWSYDLEVMSCELVEGTAIDLDYRFPMKVHSQERPILDVSRGSTGIIEIINLAYRFTAMHYLGLQNSPLYLDEAGISFDVAHRAEFGRLIRTIIEQNTFSQVFLISHYFELYGGLANVETCVLNALNIATPAVYNTHVTIE